ncbi:MAG: hypothetical protein LBC21_02265 [Oscillospiraceae bacterium]|jgi:hypothetical protein|nr:hypothetical protein [Oscillospiraceae bacterium]
MVKISRVLLLIVIFLSVISLIAIFATALFSGGEGEHEPAATAPSVGGESHAPQADAPTAPVETGAPTPTPAAPAGTGGDAAGTLPAGGRIAFKALGSEKTFLALIDEERFRRVQEGAEAFFDTTAENNRVFIEFCYFPDMVTQVSAPRFLSDYVGSATPDDRGEESIGQTGLNGRALEATDGENTFEAWLIDENQGGALAIVMSYSTQSQRAALREIFDSLALVE